MSDNWSWDRFFFMLDLAVIELFNGCIFYAWSCLMYEFACFFLFSWNMKYDWVPTLIFMLSFRCVSKLIWFALKLGYWGSVMLLIYLFLACGSYFSSVFFFFICQLFSLTLRNCLFFLSHGDRILIILIIIISFCL